MYLRFRNSQLSPSKSDGTFEKLYQQIHGHLPEYVRPDTKPSFKVQIYLVKNQRINKKPVQIYIGILANYRIFIDENDKMCLENNFWEEVWSRLKAFNVPPIDQAKLVNRIKNYLFF